MENKILIPLAIFCLSILLVQSFYTIPSAYAIQIEVVSFGGNGVSNEERSCEFVSIAEYWCPTSTGIYIWNPTSRSVSTIIQSARSFNDVECSGTFCYSWDKTATTTANLTKWRISDRSLVNTTVWTGNTGFSVANGIGLAVGTGSDTLMIPTEGQLCGGGSDEKGICIFEGIDWLASRFISGSTTSDTAGVRDVIWNEGSSSEEFTANRMIVKWQQADGTMLYYNINLGDTDSSFVTTQICNTGVVANVDVTTRLVMIDGIVYDPNGTSDLMWFDTTNGTCTESVELNIVDEGAVADIDYSSTDNVFIVSAYTDDGGVVEAGTYIFNGTQAPSSFNRITKVNITASASNFVWTQIINQGEGEIQVWRGTNMVIISDILTSSGESPNEAFCSLPENVNILTCRLENTPPLTGTSTLFNQSATNIVCQIGLLSCTQDEDGNFVPDNPDIQTNGVGYLILAIALGVMISIFWVASGGRLVDIPTFVWMLGTIAIVGGLTAFEFIDPTLLIISAIIVIALATAKAKGVFSDAQLFSGES